MNQRFFWGYNSIEIYRACNILEAFLDSKKNELRKLTNDKSKTPFNSTIHTARAILDRKLKINFRASDFGCPEKIMDMISDFKFMVKTLLKSDGRIISENGFNYTLFDAAIVTGYPDIVKTFLKYNFKINSMYNTPFHRHCLALNRAAQSGQENMVTLLINYGADINRKDFHNKTALFYAIQANHVYTTLKLLNHNAKIDDPDLLTAGIINLSDGIVRLLLERGVPVNQPDLCGRVPLHFVSNSNKQFIDRDFERAQIARAIIDSGAFVNAKTRSGITPLHAAVLQGFYRIAEVLLTNGAEVDEFVSMHRTALFYAAYNTHPEVVKLLLMYGADINILDDVGKSALDMANDSGTGRYAIVSDESDFHDDDEMNYTYRRMYTSSCANNREETIKTLQKHIIKMITAGMFVRKDIKCKVNMVEMESFQNMCYNELKMIKTIPLVNHLTGFDIMRMRLTELISYIKNPDIRDVLKQYHYSKLFPLYGIIIHAQIQKAIRRQKKILKPYDSFGPSLNLPGYPTLDT
ncbi:serine/threonine-protein phosphatase 6 regulatory ankyrin repeat subunit C-like [Chelonus insularis]|uniref:serine/threonine-protein phosphatase 6 regulatory ankyrin repeat subunit C-like n=1 Tax=Chelonus insularis TaxID=460826 RepID=UPI00158B6DAD|nr:serine/threonine-protein phosphatase 6 regulatory ankyrin repeat subunit C-like [Chelonus insularis]